MADSISLPDIVNISGYGGDTLIRRVLAPAELVDGLEWTAQVKSKREDDLVDAEFVIIPPTVDDPWAYLTLPSAETTRLVSQMGRRAQVRTEVGTLAWVLKYSGVWDCQVSGIGGTDPVTTLAQGTFTLSLDVTREDTV